jgi:hypothetical protein
MPGASSVGILTYIQITLLKQQLLGTIVANQLEYDPVRCFATVYRCYKYKHCGTDRFNEVLHSLLPEKRQAPGCSFAKDPFDHGKVHVQHVDLPANAEVYAGMVS